MARGNKQNSTSIQTNTFMKGLNKDSDPSFVSEGMWTHARNAVNNTSEGDLGTISNESSNYLCSRVAESITNGRKIIVGAIHLYSDKWVIYTAVHVAGQINSINSEIGLFEEDLCRYRPIVQDPCLNLNELNLVTGSSREKEDCSFAVYWSDGLNPDRYLNVGDPQTWPGDDFIFIGNNTYSNNSGQTMKWPGVTWIQECKGETCEICIDTDFLDCDKIRLARLVKTPCLHVESGKAGGTLRNGSYFAMIAYSIRGQKVTDWYSPSNVQPLWFEQDPQGALEITIEADSENFEEFILVVVSNINQGAVAKQVGIYSTNTTKVYIDQIKEDLPAIPIEQLPIQTPIFEKSDQIVEVSNYLLRVGPTSKFDFNYQPLANLIVSKWVSVEYDEQYYVSGGYKPSYLRDEVYAFFIRWVYNTGDKSPAYHIPGRFPRDYQLPTNGATVFETQDLVDNNTLFSDPSEAERVFEIYNTALIDTTVPTELLDDGGLVIAKGLMGYHESTEIYPDNQPQIWNSTYYCWTGTSDTRYDLCGKPIRHHKMPDQTTHPTVIHHVKDPNNADANKIRILGVEFENIIYPKDQEGNDIPGIVGYEILRGSREGNKTIIAKGMINNLRPYNLRGNAIGNRKGLYPNYPFNTIIPVNPSNSNNGPLNVANSFSNPYDPLNQANDPYIIRTNTDNERTEVRLSDIPRNIVTFHSPDTGFRNPFLSTVEMKLYGTISGISDQYFIEPAQHPEHKLLDNAVVAIAFLAGALEAIISLVGKRTINAPVGYFEGQYEFPLVGGNSAPVGLPTNAAPSVAYLGAVTATYTSALEAYYASGASLADAFTGGTILAGIEANICNSINSSRRSYVSTDILQER
jgi:hypothetical protein